MTSWCPTRCGSTRIWASGSTCSAVNTCAGPRRPGGSPTACLVSPPIIAQKGMARWSWSFSADMLLGLWQRWANRAVKGPIPLDVEPGPILTHTLFGCLVGVCSVECAVATMGFSRPICFASCIASSVDVLKPDFEPENRLAYKAQKVVEVVVLRYPCPHSALAKTPPFWQMSSLV